MSRRIERLNSLFKQVISDIIRKEVRHPRLPKGISVMRVEVTNDLHYAKVYVSLVGDKAMKQEALTALQSAAGFIAVHASKEVVTRYFPALTFYLDDSLDKQMRIDELISQIEKERQARE